MPTFPLFFFVFYFSHNILSVISFRADSCLAPLAHLSNLRTLNLTGNNLKNIESVFCIRNLTDLKILFLEGNPLSFDSKFPSLVFRVLPNVEKIDIWYDITYSDILHYQFDFCCVCFVTRDLICFIFLSFFFFIFFIFFSIFLFFFFSFFLSPHFIQIGRAHV